MTDEESSEFTVKLLKSKDDIFKELSKSIDMNDYAIGDLDDFFFPYCRFYHVSKTSVQKGSSSEVAVFLVYCPPKSMACILLFTKKSSMGAWVTAFLRSKMKELPSTFYLHTNVEFDKIVKNNLKVLVEYGEHLKMKLAKLKKVKLAKEQVEIISFNEENLKKVRKLYKESYPGNFFTERMLKTDRYFGIQKEGNVVAVAGVHVLSKKYSVACLGNIVTEKKHRKKGFAVSCIASLIQTLRQKDKIKNISLNVKKKNKGAIHVYEKLGFTTSFRLNEYKVCKKKG